VKRPKGREDEIADWEKPPIHHPARRKKGKKKRGGGGEGEDRFSQQDFVFEEDRHTKGVRRGDDIAHLYLSCRGRGGEKGEKEKHTFLAMRARRRDRKRLANSFGGRKKKGRKGKRSRSQPPSSVCKEKGVKHGGRCPLYKEKRKGEG